MSTAHDDDQGYCPSCECWPPLSTHDDWQGDGAHGCRLTFYDDEQRCCDCGRELIVDGENSAEIYASHRASDVAARRAAHELQARGRAMEAQGDGCSL